MPRLRSGDRRNGKFWACLLLSLTSFFSQTLALHKAAGHSLPSDTTLCRLLQTAQGMACLGLPRPALELVGRGRVPEYQEEVWRVGENGEEDLVSD